MSLLQTAESLSDAIVTRMSQISVANGYETDIGLRVYRGARKVDEDLAPCAVLIEGADKVEMSASKHKASAKINQSYLLHAYVPCDLMNPNVAAHKAIRDFKKAIFHDGTTMNGQVVSVTFKGRDIGPRVDGVAIVLAQIEIEVSYVEDLSAP